jgi:hypothetical protein
VTALPKRYEDISVWERVIYELDRKGYLKIQGTSVEEKKLNAGLAIELIEQMCAKRNT